jgi:hypothetical protein
VRVFSTLFTLDRESLWWEGGKVGIFGGEILAQERSVADGVLIKCIDKVGRTINRVLLKNKQLFW